MIQSDIGKVFATRHGTFLVLELHDNGGILVQRTDTKVTCLYAQADFMTWDPTEKETSDAGSV